MGGFVISPLPPVLPKDVSHNRAPLLGGRSPASSLLRAHPPPSRLPPLSWLASYTAYLAPPCFKAGRGGLLQLLSASLSPCRRCLPRRSGSAPEPVCAVPMLPSPRFHGLGLRGS